MVRDEDNVIQGSLARVEPEGKVMNMKPLRLTWPVTPQLSLQVTAMDKARETERQRRAIILALILVAKILSIFIVKTWW